MHVSDFQPHQPIYMSLTEDPEAQHCRNYNSRVRTLSNCARIQSSLHCPCVDATSFGCHPNVVNNSLQGCHGVRRSILGWSLLEFCAETLVCILGDLSHSSCL